MSAPWKSLPAALRPSTRGLPLLGLALVVGASLVHGEAKAGVAPVTSRSQLAGPGNEFIDWGDLGVAGTDHNQPFDINTNSGTSVDVSMAYIGNPFSRLDQVSIGSPTPWQGNFSIGDRLLWTNVLDNTENPLSLSWTTQGFAGVGTQIQANSPGAFTARVTAYDAANILLGSVDVPGVSNSNPGEAVFAGIRSTTATNPIYRVDFSILPGSSDIASFAINQVDFNTTFDPPSPDTTVPAPLPLFGISAGFAFSRRLKARLRAPRQR